MRLRTMSLYSLHSTFSHCTLSPPPPPRKTMTSTSRRAGTHQSLSHSNPTQSSLGCFGGSQFLSSHFQGGGKNAIRIFSHFPHFFSHFLGRSLSVMFKRIHSSGIV